jgi:import inner membrane translocase subunit TIM23
MSLRTLAPSSAPLRIGRRPSPATRRFASSSPSSSSTPLQTSAAEAAEAKKVDWPTYLNLRRRQRTYGLIASVPTTLIGGLVGGSYFVRLLSPFLPFGGSANNVRTNRLRSRATRLHSSWVRLFLHFLPFLTCLPSSLRTGIEPVYAYGAATLGCVGLGWLAGPTVGGALWKLTHRKVAKAMEAKDKGASSAFSCDSRSGNSADNCGRAEFFNHIVRWRADPSRQSGPFSFLRSFSLVSPPSTTIAHLAPLTASNPSPDFYAEKVGSLQSYRVRPLLFSLLTAFLDF